MAKCTVCNREAREEDAPILAFGIYGDHKVLCDECAADIDEASTSRDLTAISDAMDRIGKKMSENDPDGQTISTVTSIMSAAADRAKAIKDGTYDFSLDGKEREEVEDIPEEMLEAEEDRVADAQDAEKSKRFDKIYNWVAGIIFAALGAYAIYMLLDAFVF